MPITHDCSVDYGGKGYRVSNKTVITFSTFRLAVARLRTSRPPDQHRPPGK